MTRKNKNHSYFHYKSETTDENGEIKVKYHFTLKEICDEFNTSTFSIYKFINEGYKANKLQNVAFFKIYKPAFIKLQNPEIKI
jgi:hypothetical protein